MKLLVAVLGGSLLATASIHANERPDLDSTISSVKAEIAEAASEEAKYSGGALLTEIQLRSVILKSTLAMLEQQRIARDQGITLTFQDPLPRITLPTADKSVVAELTRTKAEAQAAHDEAARYSGGLIQAMALVHEATARATLAAIEQRVVLAELGLPLPMPPQDTTPVPPKTPGTVASDRDALQ